MAQYKYIGIKRTITWTGNSSETAISFSDYVDLMKEYGKEKSKSVRSSRKYLRSLGLELDRNGDIIVEKQ